jgi:outer membrane protein assembly factor BamB
MQPARFAILATAAILVSTATFAQYGRGAWTSFGGDSQRTGWNKIETEITPATAPNLKLEWSIHLDNPPLALHNLTAPLARAQLYTAKGVVDVVVVAGSSDRLYVIDADTGKIYWQKMLGTEGTPARTSSWLCPNGLTATPLLGAAPAGSGSSGQALYILASDGKLHAFNLISGEDLMPPTPFLPPFAKMWSLNTANGMIYSTTSQSCNGAASGVYAMDVSTPERNVSHFQTAPNGAGVWGRAGVALTRDGRVVFETGDGPYDPASHLYADSVLALSGKDLQLADYFTPANRAWITKKDLDMGNMTPAVFSFQNRELIAAAGKEGVIYLLDSQSLGGADHRTPLYRSPQLANDEVNLSGKGFWGAFTTWQDPSGTRWLSVPANGPPAAGVTFPHQYGDTPDGSVMAFKVEASGGSPSLIPAWNSVNMGVPTPAIAANGMLFVLSDGDDPAQISPSGAQYTTVERIQRASHATLYILDATTGRVLFSSGDTIKSFSHFGGIAVAGGRIYVPTFDGTLYCFSQGSPLPGH